MRQPQLSGPPGPLPAGVDPRDLASGFIGGSARMAVIGEPREGAAR